MESGSDHERRLPSYMRSTKSGRAHYANLEQDAIKNAFSSRGFGNLRGIKRIEPNFRGQEVNRRLEIVTGVRPTPKETPFVSKRGTGVFSVYQYYPDDYNRGEDLRRRDMQRQKELRLDPEHKGFNTAGLLKTRKVFSSFDRIQDPYELQEKVERVRKRAHSAKNVHGPFKPSGRASSSTLTRTGPVGRRGILDFKELADYVCFNMRKDWPEYFLGGFVREDKTFKLRPVSDFAKASHPGALVILFSTESNVTAKNAIHKYMTTFYLKDPEVKNLGFQKETLTWGCTATKSKQWLGANRPTSSQRIPRPVPGRPDGRDVRPLTSTSVHPLSSSRMAAMESENGSPAGAKQRPLGLSKGHLNVQSQGPLTSPPNRKRPAEETPEATSGTKAKPVVPPLKLGVNDTFTSFTFLAPWFQPPAVDSASRNAAELIANQRQLLSPRRAFSSRARTAGPATMSSERAVTAEPEVRLLGYTPNGKLFVHLRHSGLINPNVVITPSQRRATTSDGMSARQRDRLARNLLYSVQSSPYIKT